MFCVILLIFNDAKRACHVESPQTQSDKQFTHFYHSVLENKKIMLYIQQNHSPHSFCMPHLEIILDIGISEDMNDLSDSKCIRSEEADIVVLLLGAAQDGGFPQFGCYCSNCCRVYDGSLDGDTAVSLALIDRVNKKWFLVEAAPQLHEQWMTFATNLKDLSLSGVILTHAHVGHYPGLLFLGKEGMNSTGIPVYASSEMHEFLQANEPWGVLYRNQNITRVDISEGRKENLTSLLSITPKFVVHRRDFTDTCAFYIHGGKRVLFFCPDIDSWETLEPDLCTIINSVDISLLDATFFDDYELPGRDMTKIPHPRVAHTIDIVRKGCSEMRSEVVLIHLNHSNRLWTDAALKLSLIQHGIYVGIKGKEWTI